jgi:hypothetical protein
MTNLDKNNFKRFSDVTQLFANTSIRISLQYHQNKIYDSHEIPLDDPHACFKFHDPLSVSADVKIADYNFKCWYLKEPAKLTVLISQLYEYMIRRVIKHIKWNINPLKTVILYNHA